MSIFTDLKQRVADTGYLPLWLRNGLASVNPTVIAPVIEPAPEGTPKWCPFGRVSKVQLNGDGTATHSRAAPHNRLFFMRKNEESTIEAVGSSLQVSYCVGDRCQLWDAKHLTCGMRNPLLHVQDAVTEAQALHKVMYPDQYPATDGTGDDPAP